MYSTDSPLRTPAPLQFMIERRRRSVLHAVCQCRRQSCTNDHAGHILRACRLSRPAYVRRRDAETVALSYPDIDRKSYLTSPD